MKRAAATSFSDQDNPMEETKRARSSEAVYESIDPEFKRLQCASFPSQIASLPHVLKSIDVFLMSPEEAIVEAANTSHLEWLRSLLDQHDAKCRDAAMIAAARDGYIEAVRWLMLEIIGAQTGKLDYASHQVVSKAACAAASQGHLVVVELLLLEIEADDEREDEMEEESDYDSGDDVIAPSHDATWKVLEVASAHGHLGVVKFAAEYARETEYKRAVEACNALKPAIRGGHFEVVQFLLEPGRYRWNYTEALELAITEGQDAIAQLIYAGSPQLDGKSLLCNLAGAGNLRVVTYLYNNGHNGPELVNDAFVQAARHGRTDVVAFLLGSGPISPEAFDSAFENAAASGVITTLRFLYEQRRVSRPSVISAFQRAQNVAVIEFLGSNETIPATSVVAAFKNATRYLGLQYDSRTQLEILGLLRKRTDIPATVINEVVAQATLEFRPGILQTLGVDSRLTPEVRSAAFAKAIDMGNLQALRALFHENQIPPERVAEAFVRAAGAGHTHLVKFLNDNPVIDASVEQAAILAAARANRNEMTQQLLKREVRPIEILQEALAATHHKKLKKSLRASISQRQDGRI